MAKIKLRSMIVPRPGCVLVQCDLSQAESWIVAFMSQDPNMIHSLTQSDIHADTAGVLFHEEILYANNGPTNAIDWKASPFVEMRYIGKRNNHANSYGMGPERNAQVINKDSTEPPYVTVTIPQCRVYQERWHSHYRNVKTVYWNEVEEQLNRSRKLVTPYGRERMFYGAWGKELFKSGYAHLPQSTVADHFNGAIQPELGVVGGLREIRRQIIQPSRGEIRICNQSHDSALVEVPTVLARDTALEMKALLERPLVIKGEMFTIPADAEMGDNWGKLEKVK